MCGAKTAGTSTHHELFYLICIVLVLMLAYRRFRLYANLVRTAGVVARGPHESLVHLPRQRAYRNAGLRMGGCVRRGRCRVTTHWRRTRHLTVHGWRPAHRGAVQPDSTLTLGVADQKRTGEVSSSRCKEWRLFFSCACPSESGGAPGARRERLDEAPLQTHTDTVV